MENQLPINYAQVLLELESSLQEECTMQRIRELNDHYRIGIDYYISVQPRKAIHLQKKMTALLSDPDNLRVLQQNSKASTTQKLSPTTNKSQLNQRKINEEVKKFHNVADTCIKSLLENSDKAFDKIKNLQKKDLNKQQEGLKQRIMLKRARSTQKLKKILQMENSLSNDHN